MVESVPYDPYDASPVTGTTLQKPPVGTVPFGFIPFEYGADSAEAIRAGLELVSPLKNTDADRLEGKSVYETFCQICHGVTGVGDGPIIGRFPNPPSLLAERASSMPDGQMYHILTVGQGLMPPYAVQVTPTERWQAVLHVRLLQQANQEQAR